MCVFVCLRVCVRLRMCGVCERREVCVCVCGASESGVCVCV